MNLTHEVKNNVLWLHISGDMMGEVNGMQLINAVNDTISDNVKNCVLDIAEMRYVNSSGIGVLITILTKCRNKGGEAYLLSPAQTVRKMLMITKLDSVFKIFDTVNQLPLK